jgi:hypothetical protein
MVGAAEVAAGDLKRQKESHMTRAHAALISVVAIIVLAFSAVPAAASNDGYRSVNSIMGGSGSAAVQPGSSDYRSLNSITGSSASTVDQPTSSGYRTVNSIVGGSESPKPSPLAVDSPGGDGFDWLDALIGAFSAGLLLSALAAARSVARHRRATAESRV